MLTRREILTAGLGGLAGLGARDAWSAPGLGSLAAATVVTTTAQINHVLVDDEWIYWTEYAETLKIRKISKAGGQPVDIVQEPFRDERAFKISYAHLQQIDDTLYWTRQKVGFDHHWSIRRVSKNGGTASVVLPDDHSVEPLYFQGWRAGGGRIVAIVRNPAPLDLAANTLVGVYDPASATWGSLLAGRTFAAVYVLAVDANSAYLRGRTRDGSTQIGAVALAHEPDSYQALLTRRGEDADLTEPGCTDGTNLYFWTKRGSRHTLAALPLAGGGVTSLYNGAIGAGLSTNGADLYWANGQNVLRMPVTGGAVPVNVTGSVYRQSTVADLALDETSLYVVKKVPDDRFGIVRITKPAA